MSLGLYAHALSFFMLLMLPYSPYLIDRKVFGLLNFFLELRLFCWCCRHPVPISIGPARPEMAESGAVAGEEEEATPGCVKNSDFMATTS